MVYNESLLEPLSEEEPVGPNLEYDPNFLELETRLRPATARMVEVDLQENEVAEDWLGTKAIAYDLAAKTRDLRVSVRLTRTLARTDGVSGLAAGLALTAGLLERYWENVHPQPDADDNMDIMMRFNALGDLTDPEMLRALELVSIAGEAPGERISLQQIEVAIGKHVNATEDDRSIANGQVNAVFANPDVVTILPFAKAALEQLQSIKESWDKGISAFDEACSDKGLGFESMPAPEFSDLKALLGDMVRHISSRLPGLEEQAGLEGGETGTGVAPSVSEHIKSRVDVNRTLLAVVEWYQKNEPSSPVPIILERARSMISKSFLEIVEELGDTGLAEAKKVMQVAHDEGGD